MIQPPFVFQAVLFVGDNLFPPEFHRKPERQIEVHLQFNFSGLPLLTFLLEISTCNSIIAACLQIDYLKKLRK